MTLPATHVPVSGARLVAAYELHAPLAEARERAEAICVEQTIEFPADLVADDDIRSQIIGRIESLEESRPGITRAKISYAIEVTAFALPQLLSVVYGNCSLLPGVRLVGLDLPDPLLRAFHGPRFGVRGLRELLGAPHRPLLATALKPMGLSAAALAEMAGTLARGGIDLIKDDQGLADQPWATFAERVPRCADAVREANVATGGHARYLPVLNAPTDELCDRAHLAKEAGAGGFLVMPGVSGLDAMRALAEDPELGLPIMAHPTAMGSFVTTDSTGMAPGLLLGTLVRLAGADLSIFPSYGGRFGNFSRAVCREIVEACAAPLGSLAPCLPTPGGGILVDRVAELLAFYGSDVALLIGGDLHRGDLLDNVRRMRAAVEAYATASDARAATAAPAAS